MWCDKQNSKTVSGVSSPRPAWPAVTMVISRILLYKAPNFMFNVVIEFKCLVCLNMIWNLFWGSWISFWEETDSGSQALAVAPCDHRKLARLILLWGKSNSSHLALRSFVSHKCCRLLWSPRRIAALNRSLNVNSRVFSWSPTPKIPEINLYFLKGKCKDVGFLVIWSSHIFKIFISLIAFLQCVFP